MSENKKLVPKRRFKEFQNTDAWEQLELGVLGSVAMNKRIFKEQTSESGDIPFYKIGTFGGEADAFISQELFDEYKSKYPYPIIGDLLISASGSIGRIVEYKGKDEYFQDSNIVWLKHDERLVNSFLKQFYSIVRWQGLEGSTIKRLYNKNILETQISLPSPVEQAKIGEFFSTLDSSIAFQQRKLEKMKSIKSAYLSEMFPAEGERKPKRRFPGFTDDWEQRELGEVADIFDGTHQTPKYISSGIKFVSVENIDTLDTEKYISEEAYNKEYSNKQAEKGDVLMTRIGDIGTAKVIETNDSLAYYVTLALLKPKGLDSYFLSNAIATTTVQNSIWRRTLHIAFPKKINLGEISQVELFVPTIDEQIKIGELFQNLDRTIAFQQQKLEKLQNIKKAYLNEMFI